MSLVNDYVQMGLARDDAEARALAAEKRADGIFAESKERLNLYEAALKRAFAVASRLARAMEALRPFAELADCYPADDYNDGSTVDAQFDYAAPLDEDGFLAKREVTVGDLRRARAVLKEIDAPSDVSSGGSRPSNPSAAMD